MFPGLFRTFLIFQGTNMLLLPLLTKQSSSTETTFSFSGWVFPLKTVPTAILFYPSALIWLWAGRWR